MGKSRCFVERRAFWQEHVERWRAGTKTAAAYCRGHGLAIRQFRYWQYRFYPKAVSQAQTGTFLEVSVAETKVCQGPLCFTGLQIETPRGYKINCLQPMEVSGLLLALRALESLSC